MREEMDGAGSGGSAILDRDLIGRRQGDYDAAKRQHEQNRRRAPAAREPGSRGLGAGGVNSWFSQRDTTHVGEVNDETKEALIRALTVDFSERDAFVARSFPEPRLPSASTRHAAWCQYIVGRAADLRRVIAKELAMDSEWP